MSASDPKRTLPPMRPSMATRLCICALISLLLFGAAAEISSADGLKPGFAVGQEWTVRSGGARVVIGRVEDWRGEKACHVSIVDISDPAGSSGAGATTVIDHVPFACSALQDSVGELVETDRAPSPAFEDGYRQWRDARGGVFAIGADEVIALMLKSMQGN